MALFKKSEKKADEAKGEVRMSSADLSHVLLRPRITEKASLSQAMNVYVFDVSAKATKTQIVEAVHKFYNVRPRKVTVAAVPRKEKRNMRTGRTGVTKGGRKAYVYLKKDEIITLA